VHVPPPGQSAFVAHWVYIAHGEGAQLAVIVVMSKQHAGPAPPSVQSAGLWQLKVPIIPRPPPSPNGLTVPPELLPPPTLLSSLAPPPPSSLELFDDDDELHAATAAPMTETTRRMRPLRMKDLRWVRLVR
jgi:hypothetical protein